MKVVFISQPVSSVHSLRGTSPAWEELAFETEGEAERREKQQGTEDPLPSLPIPSAHCAAAPGNMVQTASPNMVWTNAHPFSPALGGEQSTGPRIFEDMDEKCPFGCF